MKNLKLFIMAVISMFVSVVGVSAANTTLPTAINNTIKLDKDYILTEEYKVEKNTTLTIDLNGHELKAADEGYAINNEGTLTIIDSSSSKLGEITGNAKASAIRNDGTLTVNGVKVTSDFVALKNEPNGKMTVTDSNITANCKSTVAEGKVSSGLGIQNYGELNVNNSTIKGTNGSNALNNNKGGKVTLTNSVLTARAVRLEGTANLVGYAVSAGEEATIEVKDSVVSGQISGDVSLTGEVTTSFDNMKYAAKGTRIVLDGDTAFDGDKEVPEGVTLVIPENVQLTLKVTKGKVSTSVGSLTVKGAIEGNVDAVAYNETENKYFASLEKAVLPFNTADGDKIVVLKDTEETSLAFAGKKTGKMPISTDITIDLNGHKVTANLENNAETSLTIVDEAGNGELAGTINNSGNLVITSGLFTNVPTTEEGANTNLMGGTYPAEQLKDYVAPEGQEVIKNADGTITLKYKDADYTKLDEALAKAAEIDLTKYTSETVAVLAEAIKAADNVDRNLTVLDQATVDALAKALNDAIAGLEEVENSGSTAENPNTLDSLPLYLIGGAVAVLGVTGLGYSIKKKFEN